MSELIPIFPLELVVYPGENLNLHIFEPRYKELINDCSKKRAPFGIPAVVERKIAGLGTLVQLSAIANVQADGQMDICTEGLRVFRIQRLLKTFPGKSYSAAEVEFLGNKGAGDAGWMPTVLAGIRKLHTLLKVTKPFPKRDDELNSFDVAHQAGLSLKQELELLAIEDEPGRQKFLQRHLEQILPVVAEMESLKRVLRK
jgi:Lon protease-like protein